MQRMAMEAAAAAAASEQQKQLQELQEQVRMLQCGSRDAEPDNELRQRRSSRQRLE